MNLEDLKRVIPHKQKPGRLNTKTGKTSPPMDYIDARQVMDLLDEVVGMANWQTDYKVLDGKMYCGIGVFTERNSVYSWVWKWNMGTESDFEAEKGEASDAFKRAAVLWGIGRFLYGNTPKPTQQTSKPVQNTAGRQVCDKHGEEFQKAKTGRMMCFSCVKDFYAQ